jgi:transcriptional regulator with XRE-family HTH domain
MKINLDKIEKERIRQGLTKTALAGLVGITKSAYSDFVRRKATKLSTLDKIAKALGYDPKDLLIT